MGSGSSANFQCHGRYNYFMVYGILETSLDFFN